MKKTKITWGNLATISEEEFAEGRVVLTGLRGGDLAVTGFGHHSCDEYVTLAPFNRKLTRDSFFALYPSVRLDYLESEPPRDLTPTEPGSEVRITGSAAMSTTRISITWDDLEYLPTKDYTEGRVFLTGLADDDRIVTGADWGESDPYVTVDPDQVRIPRSAATALRLGLVREVEEHPHGLIPEEPWAIIQLGDGRRAARIGTDSARWVVRDQSGISRSGHMWENDLAVQALADSHGFEVLVPSGRVAEAREEGRLVGIREVYEKYGPLRVIDGAGRLSYYLEHAYSAEMFEEGDR